MVITLEQPPTSGTIRFKLNETLAKGANANAFTATPVAPPPVAPANTKTVAAAAPTTPVVSAKNEVKADKADFTNETGIQKALRQLEESYVNMKESINLKKFDAAKIDDYIQKAEKRTGLPYSVEEKEQFRQMAKSTDTEMLKLLCMELHVGLTEKAEKEAMAALGRLILHRNQTDSLKAYMDIPGKDPNIKAYIRTVLMMHRVENWMNTVEDVKRKVKKPFQWLVPAVQHQDTP